MTDLMRYAAALEGAGEGRKLPPVDKWNPQVCGEIDLVIRSDGVWMHEGTPIGRPRLVRLLSTVLKREGDEYFLVTPVEKMKIRVEDAPFLAVVMRREDGSAGRRLVFSTNVGDDVVAGAGDPIELRERRAQKAPYVHVRKGLWALIARSVFYDLVSLGETREVNGESVFGVSSDGAFFPFGAAAAVYGDD
jgi:hypothetical protein